MFPNGSHFARRSSVIVDMERPVFTPPLFESRGIPSPVLAGMYAAAWARAEFCPLTIVAGRLEPHTRFEPTDALASMLERAMGSIIGVLGFGVPIALDDKRRPYGASWPLTVCTPIGAIGRN